MSLWSDQWAGTPEASFEQPVPDPGTDPEDGPFACVQFNQAWAPYVCGALLQLCQPSTWGEHDSSDPTGVLARATKLLNLFGLSQACDVSEARVTSVLIPAGAAYVTVPIVFAANHPLAPVVVATAQQLGLKVSVSNITPDGFDMTVASDVPVLVDTPGDVDWGTWG